MSLLLASLRPSIYPCFRPRSKDASRPSFLTSNCFRPIPTHILFHEQYSAEGWPSLTSVDQGSKMHAASLLRNARTRSRATSPLRKPGDSRSASQWLTWQLGKRRSCLWYKNTCLTGNGKLEIGHGIETRSQTPSKAMSIFPVGQRLLFCCILVDNKSSNCNLISDSKLCSYGSHLFEIYYKGNLTSPLTQSNNQLTRPRSPHP